MLQAGAGSGRGAQSQQQREREREPGAAGPTAREMEWAAQGVVRVAVGAALSLQAAMAQVRVAVATM